MKTVQALIILVATSACSGGIDTSKLSDFKDIRRADQRSDGLYNVICMDGSFEIGVTAEDITSGKVCDTEPSSTPTLYRQTFLKDLGNVLSDSATAFLSDSDRLHTASQQYCQTLSPDDLRHARLSWAQAMQSWERITPMQVGPLAANAGELSARILVWPQSPNTCRIDGEALQALKMGDAYELPIQLNRKGLQAAEYLLYQDTLQTACSSTSSVGKEWQEHTDRELRLARCLYLVKVSSELTLNAQELVDAWGPRDHHYFTRHNSDPALIQAMMQDLFTSLFYTTGSVKNYKLGAVSGIDPLYPNCPTATDCVRRQQYPYSQLSREAVLANLSTFRTMMLGENGSAGFAALLAQEGGPAAQPAVQRTKHRIASLEATAAAPVGSLADIVAASFGRTCSEDGKGSWFCEMNRLLQDIEADFLKEYSPLLKLEAPAAAQGDND